MGIQTEIRSYTADINITISADIDIQAVRDVIDEGNNLLYIDYTKKKGNSLHIKCPVYLRSSAGSHLLHGKGVSRPVKVAFSSCMAAR